MAGNDIIVTIFFKISDPLTDGTVMNRDDFCDLLGRHASLEELEGEAVAFSFGFTGEGAGVGAGHQRDLSCQVPSGKRSTSQSGVVVDLLFASSGIEPEIVEQAERIAVFHGIVLPVATVGHLLAMKILSHHPDTRPQDVVDIKNLLTTLTPAEEVRCIQALRLIQARGFHRGRDLEGMLATLRIG